MIEYAESSDEPRGTGETKINVYLVRMMDLLRLLSVGVNLRIILYTVNN